MAIKSAIPHIVTLRETAEDSEGAELVRGQILCSPFPLLHRPLSVSQLHCPDNLKKDSILRTLITGGAGFIGSHLCDRFLAEGHEVVAVDNFITGTPENIAHLFGNPRFKLIGSDISNPLKVPGKIDNVLHFASPASPVDYLEFTIQTLKVGALGTHNTLGIAKAHIARYLLASTSEVYGDPLEHPQKESYWGNVNPIGIRGVYDEAKRFAESMTMAYHRVHGVNTRMARIFNTYGPRLHP